MLNKIIDKVKSAGEPHRVALIEKYMMAVPGGYGEGDTYLAVRVPELRKISKEYQTLHFNDIACLLRHEIHDVRLLALFIMVLKYKSNKEPVEHKKALLDIYLAHTDYINNWDLVDSSAHFIVGAWCYENDSYNLLLDLSESSNMWENRIAMIASLWYIRQGEYVVTLRLAEKLLHHKHDLIHKAVGWMLRELGKRNQELEMEFLNKYYQQMPRTMLRYAIEKFDKALRKDYLLGQI